ncbi:hypothetical protein ACWO41_001331 [Clostridium sporogenes]
MKTKLINNKGNIILLIISFIIVVVFKYYNFINFDNNFNRGDHFNIITINSVLAGFLFTSLGIIVGGLGKEKIDRLERGGYLDKYYGAIYIAILFNIVSIISGILIIFGSKSNNWLIYFEQISLIMSVIFFIKSMNNLRKIINNIRESN